MRFASLRSIVASLTTATLLLAPMSQAQAQTAPREERPQAIEKMSGGERLLNLGIGAGLIGGGVATMTVGTTAVYTGLAAMGIGAVAAPVVVLGLIGVGIGAGTYFLVKGLVGRRLVDASPLPPAGVNVGRGDDTRPRAPAPGRASRPGIGGASGAGMQR